MKKQTLIVNDLHQKIVCGKILNHSMPLRFQSEYWNIFPSLYKSEQN